jgi:hypothetical protein
VGANPKVASVNRTVSEEDALTEWEKLTPRSGLYLNDGEILLAMDSSPDRRYLRIASKPKKNADYLATLEQFGALFEKITDQLRRMGNALHEGRVDKNPIRIGSKYCSCDHCDLKYCCRHPEPEEKLLQNQEKGTDEDA